MLSDFASNKTVRSHAVYLRCLWFVVEYSPQGANTLVVISYKWMTMAAAAAAAAVYCQGRDDDALASVKNGCPTKPPCDKTTSTMLNFG